MEPLLIDIPQLIREEEQRGAFSRIRLEFASLVTFLNETNLRDAILKHHLERILEVGIGSSWNDIEALLKLRDKNNKPILASDNLWVVDPSLQSSPPIKIAPKVTYKPLFVENLAEMVKNQTVDPFDLIFAKGVVSHGAQLFLRDGSNRDDPESLRKNILAIESIVTAMKDCLSETGFLVMSTLSSASFLVLTEQKLKDLGLTPLFTKQQTGKDAKTLFKSFQEAGIFPEGAEENLFSLVICKKS